MTTYCQTKGHEFIDWNERLNRKPEEVSIYELRKWREDSRSWITCACGNQCDVIERDEDGSPIDPILKSLGVYFDEELRVCLFRKNHHYHFDFNLAKSILHQIEQRSAELIKEIKQNN